MIRVLIVDDQEMVREGLRVILASDPAIRVVGCARDGAEAVERVAHEPVDLVLMDLRMPILGGVEATRQIRQSRPAIRVLVLTSYATDEMLFDAIRAGAAGYLLKDSSRDTLLAAVKGTHAGATHVDPAVAGRLFAQITQPQPIPPSSLVAALSTREHEVLGLIGNGLSNAEIAATLHLAEGTVRNYVSEVLAKLGVPDRTKAAVLAVQHGLARR